MAKLNALMMDTITTARYDALSSSPPGRASAGRPSPTGTTARSGPILGSHRAPKAFGAQPALDYRALIEPACRAISAAHDLWRTQAFFRGIVIQGPIATGGTVEGPMLGPLVRTQFRATLGPAASQPLFGAIADALGDQWALFQASVSVPGLPWYPTFQAFPGPQAPPTPNVPTPLAACRLDSGAFAASALVAAMKRRSPNPAPDVDVFFQAIAEGFQSAVTAWIPLQTVANVLGRGPVPSYAPPFVPTGPVVVGDNIPTPGHFVT